MSSERIYTTKEAAEILKISMPTMLKYIKHGKVKAVKVFGTWQIKHSAIEPFLEYVK